MRWIRVEVAIGGSPMIGALADALGIPVAEAVGLCVLVFAKLPEFAKDGGVFRVPDSTVEQWAVWRGKRKAFAAAFRQHLCDEDGFVRDWERCNGSAIRESEATAERVRNLRAKRKEGTPDTEPVRTPLLRSVRRTAPVSSPSNGTGTGTGTSTSTTSGVAGSPKEGSEGEAPPQSRVENPAPSGGNPPATATASGVVTRFTARFYRHATPARRADISSQMTAAMLSTGVQFQGSTVRAVDADHLDDCCLEVMEDPPRDSNAAFVLVLQKLRDTYLEVTSARVKALQPPKRAVLPVGMTGDAPAGATPVRAALAGILDRLEHTEEGGS